MKENCFKKNYISKIIYFFIVLFTFISIVKGNEKIQEKNINTQEKIILHEKILKEYTNYVTNIDEKVKIEEAKYIDNLHKLDREIKTLINKKLSLKQRLSNNCLDYIKNKSYYEKQLSAFSTFKKNKKKKK